MKMTKEKTFQSCYCAECARRTLNAYSRKLGDGYKLCLDCASIIPSFLADSFFKVADLAHFKELKDYVEYSNEELRSVFTETHTFYSLHLDEWHGLFYIGDKIDENTMFMHLKYISAYNIAFCGEKIREHPLYIEVTGKIVFQLSMTTPYLFYETTLTPNALKKIFKQSSPHEQNDDDFSKMRAFEKEFNDSLCIDKYEYYSPYEEYKEGDLQQAMSILSISDLSDVSLDMLEKQKSALMFFLHPDHDHYSSIEYVFRVNNAFETVKKHIENR